MRVSLFNSDITRLRGRTVPNVKVLQQSTGRGMLPEDPSTGTGVVS